MMMNQTAAAAAEPGGERGVRIRCVFERRIAAGGSLQALLGGRISKWRDDTKGWAKTTASLVETLREILDLLPRVDSGMLFDS
jgi:hypothetical protein